MVAVSLYLLLLSYRKTLHHVEIVHTVISGEILEHQVQWYVAKLNILCSYLVYEEYNHMLLQTLLMGAIYT